MSEELDLVWHVNIMNPDECVKKRKERFESLRAWEPLKLVRRVETMFDIRDPLFPLCEFLYGLSQELYSEMPPRKNGFESFLHPLNVVLNLKRSGVKDTITLLCGLMHDHIEEQVDIYKKEKGLDDKSAEGKVLLDEYEIKLVSKFEKDLYDFCEKENIDSSAVGKIIETLKLLTRLKRDFYYKSISYIFNCKDLETRERAIQVKLADRIHNILSIDCFDERGRLYQCFKNLFIINSAKQFLIENYGVKVFDWKYSDKSKATERLFTRCCKATYEAFLYICNTSADKGIFDVKAVLQLAFKKYKLEHAGIWAVTDFEDETHPMRLYQGVIRKWDSRLHYELDDWKQRIDDEKKFCVEFFCEYAFDDEKIQAIIDYKDAFSLKEVVAHLLYDHDYVLTSFLSRQLDKKGRLKVAKINN